MTSVVMNHGRFTMSYTLTESKELKETKRGIERQTHFPGQKSTDVAHVRPHAQNAVDVYPLPTADHLTGATEYTKQSIWLNAE